MSYVFQVKFDTKEQAEECMSWFDGAGEQDWWMWAECRDADAGRSEEEGFGNFTGTSVAEVHEL